MGTKTLLNSVNDVLQSVRLVTSTNPLTSLTDSPRQTFIDSAVQTINRVMLDVYASSDMGLPTEVASNTITLATGDRDYALQSDLVQMRWPLRDETNGVYIYEYEDGYLGLINSQPQPSQYTGVPTYGAISPVDGELYLDRIPTSAENGKVYAYEYDKAITVSSASDTFPFSDSAWQPFMDAVKELWKRDNNLQFDAALYQTRIGNMSSLASERQFRTSYRPDRRSWRAH